MASKNSQTHDYTRRTWGHNFEILEIFDKGQRIYLVGWGNGIKEGDFLILPNKESTTQYQVTQIKYQLDPSDMWFATAVFSPRPVEQT